MMGNGHSPQKEAHPPPPPTPNYRLHLRTQGGSEQHPSSQSPGRGGGPGRPKNRGREKNIKFSGQKKTNQFYPPHPPPPPILPLAFRGVLGPVKWRHLQQHGRHEAHSLEHVEVDVHVEGAGARPSWPSLFRIFLHFVAVCGVCSFSRSVCRVRHISYFTFHCRIVAPLCQTPKHPPPPVLA